MEAGKNIVGCYVGLEPRERIEFLYHHYDNLDVFRQAYKESVVNMIAYMRAYDRSQDKLEGIQKTRNLLNSITESAAFERIVISEYFEQNKPSDELVEEEEDKDIISWAIFEWHLMKSEFDIFKNFLNMLSTRDRRILTAYIGHSKSVKEIAKELDIEKESAEKRIYRIKQKLIENMMPILPEYGFNLVYAS